MIKELRDSGISFRYAEEQAAKFRQNGWWEDAGLLDRLDGWTEQAPDRELVTDGVGRLTYAEARGQAYRLAAELRRLGVDRGDRVLVQLPNWNEFVIIYLAAVRAGAVFLPIMPIYRHDEVGYILKRSGAKVAFTAGEFRRFDHLQMFRELRQAGSELEHLVVVRATPAEGELSLADLTRPDLSPDTYDEDAIGPRADADDGHVLIFTSGTESRPKGCLHTWNTIGFSIRGLSEAFQLDRSSVTFEPSPVSHGTGLALGVAAPILPAAPSILWMSGSPRSAWPGSVSINAPMRPQRRLLCAWRSTRSILPRTMCPRCGPGPAPARPSRRASPMKWQRSFTAADCCRCTGHPRSSPPQCVGPAIRPRWR